MARVTSEQLLAAVVATVDNVDDVGAAFKAVADLSADELQFEIAGRTLCQRDAEFAKQVELTEAREASGAATLGNIGQYN